MGNGKLNLALAFISMLLIGVGFHHVKATLKTTFLEDICYNQKTVTLNLRYQPTGILMSLPQTELFQSFNCEVILLPPRDSAVVLSIYRYDVSPDDLLLIEDSDRFQIALPGYGNFKDEKKAFISEGRILIRYRRNTTENSHLRQGFQFTYTLAQRKGRCYDNEFRCNNNLCILKEYVCDGHNHCGDSSDQKKCVPNDESTSNANRDNKNYRIYPNSNVIWISIIGAAGVVVFIIVIVFTVVVVRRSKSKRPPSAPENNNQNGGGSVPLQSVSSTVPQQPAATTNAMPSAPPAPPEHEEFSFYNRVRRSLRRIKSPEIEDSSKTTVKSEVYQVPSMYPSLEPAPQESGIENPEFKIDE